MKNLSFLIEEICKQKGLEYHSTHCTKIISDACRLGDIYIELKQIIAELQELEIAYEIKGIGKILEDDIVELSKIDHDLIKLAHKLKGKNCE